MIVQTVKFRTELTEQEVLDVASERLPQFRAIPGLVQKYYVRLPGENAFGGIYVWDSRASLDAYRESDLAASIAAAYRAIEPPVVEVMEVLFPLRD
jgi:quinol monooxygenase YgiN